MLDKFLELFSGLETSYVVGRLPNAAQAIKPHAQYVDGKVEMDYVSIHYELGVDSIQKHLGGEYAVSAVPIREDNTVVFCCIDVDESNIDFGAVDLTVRGFGGLCCTSKSGGLHIFFFMKEPVQALFVRKYLETVAAHIGFSGSEIFPKQSHIPISFDCMGNAISLPYFGGKQSCTYNGQQLLLGEFMAVAESSKLSVKDIKQNTKQNTAVNIEKSTVLSDVFTVDLLGDLSGIPPCLSTMLENVDTVGRQHLLMNWGIFFKKRDQEDYESFVSKLNNGLAVPQPRDKTEDVFKSLKKKDYNYQCRQGFMKVYCNKSLCADAKYGPDGRVPKFENLICYTTDPPVWHLTVEGVQVVLVSDELMSYSKLQKTVLEQTKGVVLPSMKKVEWDIILAKLNSKVVKIDAEPEDTEWGELEEHVQTYIFSCMGMGYTEEDSRKRKLPYIKKIDGVVSMEYSASHLNQFIISKTKNEFYAGEHGLRIKVNKLMECKKVVVRSGGKLYKRNITSIKCVATVAEEYKILKGIDVVKGAESEDKK